MIRIYGSLASPFVQRALMAARLKGHELTPELPPGGNAQSAEFRAISPLGRIPVLDDDGWTVAESGAIVTYLDQVLAGPSLTPAEPRARAAVRQIEDFGSFELFGMRAVMVGDVFKMPIAPEVVAAGRKQADGGLAAIERGRRPADTFAVGDAPTTADCLLFPLLTLMWVTDALTHARAMIEAQPGLAGYRERMAAHPVIGRSAAEMETSFAAILDRLAGGGA